MALRPTGSEANRVTNDTPCQSLLAIVIYRYLAGVGAYVFRGIDPEGLDALASTLDIQTRSMRNQARTAIELLDRNRKSADAAGIGAMLDRIENWSLDTANTLLWRAETIRSGQDAGLDVFRLARARFAAEAVFSIGTVDEDYRQWVEALQASERRVAEAITNISDWLDQGWTDWDVTNGDLRNIWRALDGLSGEELDHVIAALSPRQLERWIEEMGNSINGFSREEKRQVFSLLAGNSSGETLGKVHDAIVERGGTEDATDLGTAIRQHAPDQAIIDFVGYAIEHDLASHAYSAVAPALAVGGIDDSKAIDAMLRLVLSDDATLQLIVVDSLAATATTGSEAIVARPLGSLVEAIARGGDAPLKAAAFAAVAAVATEPDARLRDLLRTRHQIFDSATTDLMGRREVNNNATEMLRAVEPELLANAITILVSDANGVVEELASSLDPDGSSTTAFLYALVDQDEIEQLGLLVESLRGGDVVDATAFSTAGINPDYQYPHAQNLGFVAGNLRKALEQYADGEKDDIDWVVRGAGLATAAVGLFYAKVLESVSLAATATEGIVEYLSTDYWAGRTKDEIDDYLGRIIDTVETSLQPPATPSVTTPNLGEALQAWGDRYDLVRGR